MSQWTHVCGAIRFDVFLVTMHGWQGYVDDQAELILDQFQENVPEGSEGPLDIGFTLTGEWGEGHSTLNFGTLWFSGDLRDFGSHLPILNWINECISKLHFKSPHVTIVRDAAVCVEVENHGKHYLGLTDTNDGRLPQELREVAYTEERDEERE